MFWGTHITWMPCTWRECVGALAEHQSWLSEQDKSLIMGRRWPTGSAGDVGMLANARLPGEREPPTQLTRAKRLRWCGQRGSVSQPRKARRTMGLARTRLEAHYERGVTAR